MKFCTHCGKEIMDETVICPNCGCNTSPEKATEPDEINIGFCVLSALFPIFGLIYWGVKHKDSPRKAKACGITALIAWGVSLLLSMVTCAALFSSIFYMF